MNACIDTIINKRMHTLIWSKAHTHGFIRSTKETINEGIIDNQPRISKLHWISPPNLTSYCKSMRTL